MRLHLVIGTTLVAVGFCQLNNNVNSDTTPSLPAPGTAVEEISVPQGSRTSNAPNVDTEELVLRQDMYPLTEELPGTKCKAIKQALSNVLKGPRGPFKALLKPFFKVPDKAQRQGDSEYHPNTM
ncbi:hypothetical protein BJ085DRAFT_33426 [Dimargaris cristalligena]|uniref:Uncharacterized protein n=1 Tax=Dimargaris cristalligena TaxID=215637 RepID=A0A4P9ZL63_9FUNG|nr:hypothetical protein BJ085DRAFT_33426 [Dimargaris cristalligena]|eukprot:RKP33845.1 hypothetical protein BJ085DRAFT_33426 [Dimargaris cristalligena]